MANFGGGFAGSGTHLPSSPSVRSPSHLTQAQAQQSQQPNGQGHKRVYQACIPCRRRKVRCILGPVDNPHDPPCDRCRRESKECYFSATRRKRKADEDDADLDADDYVLRNGRRKLQSDESSLAGSLDRSHFGETTLPPALAAAAVPGSVRSHPLRRPRSDDQHHDGSRSSSAAPRKAGDSGTAATTDESNTPLENLEAQSVMRQEVYGPHDALDLLYKAATDSRHTKHDELSNGASASDPLQTRFATSHDRTTLNTARIPSASNTYNASQPAHPAAASAHQPVDPNISRPDPATLPGYADAIKLWARFRFVRAGWFTAPEAIEYIDYYYKYLSPLTPISPPTFDNPASHHTLLTEEPILAVTLLTIASRYKTLSGTGATCRAHAIHEQLWTYLRGMIERVLWGQEAFGGGFCGSGADESQTSSTAPWRGLRKGSLRTLGTIESFMILTEWHPRALHFPPAEVTDELLLPSAERDQPPTVDGDDDIPRPLGVGGKRIDGWLEPAWRSDRMCWMLLSTAMGLAYELGVFDDVDELLAADAITRPEYEDEAYRLRASRIKRLLLIYLSQLAGRLGWTNMVSDHLRKKDAATSRKRPTSFGDGQTPGTNLSAASGAFNYIPDLELDDQIIHCWAGISNAMNAGNERIFRSRQHTTDIIQSGKYIELLRDFQPLLRDWYKEFERFKLPIFTRHILTIEYEYVRIYVNSLSLQAVVERCTSNAGNTASAGSNASGNAAPQLSPQTQNYYGKLPLGQLGGFGAADRECVKEVVDGCRNLLRTVVDGLLPGGYLKHAPVRTYFRIISGALFLLKTFALGAPKADVEMSISLMDRTVDALRNCIVDDVHLGIRFADLLESLTSRLRNRFIHAPPSATVNAGGASMLPSVEGRSPGVHAETTGGPGPVNGQAPLSATRHRLGQFENGHGSHAATSTAAPAFSSGEPSWGKMGGFSGLENSGTPTANISATAFDPSAGSFPYTPGLPSTLNPSTPLASGLGMDHGATALGGGNGGDSSGMFAPDGMDWNDREMWYLPTGPAFFQNVGDANTVAMTAEGVNVAGLDLLDFMTMDSTGY